jgi:hypothetical protein
VLLHEPLSQFTAIDKTAAQRDASLTWICSEKELVWIDDRAVRMRWKHHQGGEVDLVVIPAGQFGDAGGMDGSETLIAHSRDSGTFHAVQVATEGPARFQALPWSPGGVRTPLHNISLLPFQDGPRSEHRGSACLVGSTEDGAIQLVKLMLDSPQARPPPKFAAVPHIKWDPQVQALAAKEATPKHDLHQWDHKAETRFEVLSARWAWLGEFKARCGKLTLQLSRRIRAHCCIPGRSGRTCERQMPISNTS